MDNEQQSNQPLQQTSVGALKQGKSRRIKVVLLALAALFVVAGAIFFIVFNQYTGVNPVTYAQCDQLEKEIDALIKQANYCEVDEDCIVSEQAAYPGLLWTLVNKDADVASIEAKKLQWQNLDCGKGRMYEQSAPLPDFVTCQENRCVSKKATVDENRVRIMADKSIYKQGEMVLITVKNNYETTKWLDPYPYSIE